MRRSQADFTYGYGDALRDGVVRPVIFLAYSGQMRWRTRAGDELSARLGDPLTQDVTAHAWRTALDPKGEWMTSVLRAADTRLSEVRRHVPDAGGLVIATDQTQARAYASLLRGLTGEPAGGRAVGRRRRPRPGSSRSRTGEQRWMVAVRMVSEGVDVPRLAVGVYATSTATPLFFAQAVGPLRPGPAARRDRVGVPAQRAAADAARRRAGGRARPRAGPAAHRPGRGLVARGRAAGRREPPGEGLGRRRTCCRSRRWRPRPSSTGCCSTAASSARRRWSAARRSRTTSGCPACWSPSRWPCCCASARPPSRRAAASGRGAASGRPPSADRATHREVAALRKELHQLVGAWAKRTGQPHGTVHAELRRSCGGPGGAPGGRRAGPRADRDAAPLVRRQALSRRLAPKPLSSRIRSWQPRIAGDAVLPRSRRAAGLARNT